MTKVYKLLAILEALRFGVYYPLSYMYANEMVSNFTLYLYYYLTGFFYHYTYLVVVLIFLIASFLNNNGQPKQNDISIPRQYSKKH
ncbi:hypothetical protein CKF54_00405 [Psittacicella hinzii]|uniref:Uncharacterized protein n=1 Tax=Psittacicella hinzii TaxID=2028575 RepID=A0A3A1YAC7_9GAMM|nr:hypothetical protein CKF54_00405 [Psittacicella hinzii]